MTYTLHEGDCLEKLQDVPSGSVDLVLTDPPYGTTACKWDAVIPFEPMWKQVWRVLKPNGAAVFTASQPFTSALVMSQAHRFKYCWTWLKSHPSGFQYAKFRPMQKHEDVVVFAAQRCTYNPQKVKGTPKASRSGAPESKRSADTVVGGGVRSNLSAVFTDEYWPTTQLAFSSGARCKSIHPTQKPVALMEYLIRTYTNAGETVLDFTMGSGTTGVAAMNTGRNFIGIERDPKYFAIASDRIRVAHETYLDSLL